VTEARRLSIFADLAEAAVELTAVREAFDTERRRLEDAIVAVERRIAAAKQDGDEEIRRLTERIEQSRRRLQVTESRVERA